MLTTITLIIIGLAFAIILAIIIRKFPALAILDVANIPGEKESKFKEQIMKSRVERDLSLISGFFGRLWLWLSKRLGGAMKFQQDKLKRIQISYRSAIKMSWRDKQKQIHKLLGEAEEAIKKEDEGEAEEKFLEAISLDQKNLAAFFRLGGFYASQKKWPEARETYQYALRLSLKRPARAERPLPGEAELLEVTPQEIYFLLAGVEKEADDLKAALENIREALEREASSPRYLDLILDLSIMKKDRKLAEESWQKLAAVNPENQKLDDWQRRIEEL